jgi:hypothetical protein
MIIMVFGICIAIALLIGLFNYIIILGIKEDMTQEISSLNATNAILAETILKLKEDFSSLNATNAILAETILKLKEDFSSLNATNAILAETVLRLKEDLSLLKGTNAELASKVSVLAEQLVSSLPEEYDYLLSSRDAKYYVKSGVSGEQVLETADFSKALSYVFANNGKVVIISSGNYTLNSDITIENKSDVILDGLGAILNLNGYSISFESNHYANNSNNQIRNFVVINGTFRLENSFRATVENMVFEECESAIEIANTETWSEGTKIENVYWENCMVALTFKTPTGNGTGSYTNTALDRCYINLYNDNSIGIMVEDDCEVSNSQWTNMRIWLHATAKTQTGLHLDGSMSETLLNDVVFESFGTGTAYGIYIGENSNTGFSLGEGTNFLGTFDSKIKNPTGKWIYGVNSVFLIEKSIEFAKEPQQYGNSTIHRYPLTISSFDAFIRIENLTAGENVTVMMTLNFVDHTNNSITLDPFVSNTTYWLTNEDLYDLYPPQSIIWNIVVVANTDKAYSNATVTIGVIGTAT